MNTVDESKLRDLCVVAYVRVSTDAQAGEDRFGVDAQREQISKFCAVKGHTVVRWVEDLGESGAKERPGFDEIVYGDVQNPPIQAVVVAKNDRVARDVNLYYYYKMLLAKKDIYLLSVAEDFGGLDPAVARMLEAFIICVAEMERENITKRTSAGRAVKSGRGGYSGGRPPFGYRAVEGTLEVNASEAETVRRIYRMRFENDLTLDTICQVLNEEGVSTRNGGLWRVSSVKAILDNEKTYRGFYRYGGKDKEWVRGTHAAILKDTGM